MANLLTLVMQRGRIKAQLTRFENFLNSYDDSAIAELQARLEKIEQTLDRFEELQDSIELADSENLDHEDERRLFEDKYFKLIAEAKQKLSPIQPIQNNNQPVAAATADTLSNQFSHNIKLPQILLPEFSGAYDKWTQFHDSFHALIHNNSTLHPSQKFYYLQAALKGEAAHVIQSLEVSAANYDTAWELLKDRFENKRVIIHSHLKGIFEFPIIAKESHSALRNLLDTFQRHFRSLKNLGEEVQNWDTILLYLLSSKIDSVTKREWETSIKKSTLTKLDDFIDFISKKCQILEAIDNKSSSKAVKKDDKVLSHVVTSKANCLICGERHGIVGCVKFLSFSPQMRFAEARKAKLCVNCLKPGHSTQDCRSSFCKRCNKRHNTLLHFENNTTLSTPVTTPESNASTSTSAETTIASHCVNNSKNSYTILSTCIINILDSQNKPIRCRALLDSGSQSNFMTNELHKKLNLKVSRIQLPVKGINQELIQISSSVVAQIQSLHNNFSTRLSFLILDRITDSIPQHYFDISNIHIPNNISLADPNFNQSQEIDILLGANIFFSLLQTGQINTGKNMPILQNTRLGWIVSGPLNLNSQSSACLLNTTIQDQLERFWQVEEVQNKSILSKEERCCEDEFVKNLEKVDSGHYQVKLPLRDTVTKIGESQNIAIQRFMNLEKKLSKDPNLKKEYAKFIKEYKDLGHMTRVEEPDQTNNAENTVYYLPHHCVIKDASSTTRLRVVFDASCKSSSGVSLNDVLMVGPKIQKDIFSIIARIRLYNYVMTADIEKMYRQVFIHQSQRDLQRIVWRDSERDELEHYRLNTVTYGTASASFLATRSLHQVSLDNQQEYPAACQIIARDFYVDDLLTGANDINVLMQMKQDIQAVLINAGFNLRKFCSNIANDNDTEYFVDDGTDHKTLGISWNSQRDILRYKFNIELPQHTKLTKRIILSTVSKIFDPLGLIGPVIILAKIILQKLWQLKTDWDDVVPISLHAVWTPFYNQLKDIGCIVIPRQATTFNYVEFELHGFCDASEKAYGACVYIRSWDNCDNMSVNLLCAKSRVAPLKKISLPRLELCGALLLVQLINMVQKSLPDNSKKIYCWSDSQITLHWITGEPSRWKTFVANRVTEIQDSSKEFIWQYINSCTNPADAISRGLTPVELQECQIWWNGPDFLKRDANAWPNQKRDENIDIPDTKSSLLTAHATIQTEENLSIFHKFSTLKKLQNVTAYMLRFVHNCKFPENKFTGPLNIEEVETAMLTLIRTAQAQEFSLELHRLRRLRPINSSSKILCLRPFIDNLSILRVGGRLTNAHIAYAQMHPIILPQRHALTELIIKSEHLKNLHAGPSTLLSIIRQEYWPICGRSVIRSVLKKCVTCFRVNPKRIHAEMGDLPSERVKHPGYVFETTGLDFAGPFLLKDGTTRTRKLVKNYTCVFVCFSTKAVHLELVGDLTSEAFLNALKRFVSRRGLPAKIFSDNATNFIGASNILNKDIEASVNDLKNEEAVRNYLVHNKIEWRFNPPRSPHFGGLWEAVVKSFKYHFKRVVGDSTLTYEQFTTVLAQIECVLNSRPLIPMSNDPQDFQFLTPGHFLIGKSLNALPQRVVTEVKGLNKYQHLQRMVQSFWKVWSGEYLHTLQQRAKWKNTTTGEIKIGSMVILVNEGSAPLHWPMGRIMDIHPGKDGVVRVVTIKTGSGVLKRAINKICVLPVTNE